MASSAHPTQKPFHTFWDALKLFANAHLIQKPFHTFWDALQNESAPEGTGAPRGF
ncbi:hypothetical protein D3C80_294680 [compost metagenome]